jgi:anthranilate synthase/aminodeoxychorismate synthase-like glutamine amidotransferase
MHAHPAAMLLIIDNYDSFVFNLARYLACLGHETLVLRNDALQPADVRALRPEALVLSPGPCGPEQAGCSLELVRTYYQSLPILGVCLGHQTIARALGGRVVRAPQPMHGRSSRVYHQGKGIFAGLPNPLTAGRYHSLVVEEASLPDCLEATAHTEEGVVMALAHRSLPVVGVQFHPESILTPEGPRLLAAFLRLAGLPAEDPGSFQELVQPRPEPVVPSGPLTF